LKDGPESVSESRARKWGSRCRGDDDNRALSQSSRSRIVRQQIFSLQPTLSSPAPTQHHSNKTSAVETACTHTIPRETTKSAKHSPPVPIRYYRSCRHLYTHSTSRIIKEHHGRFKRKWCTAQEGQSQRSVADRPQECRGGCQRRRSFHSGAEESVGKYTKAFLVI
jgi:hypothetical protein